MDNKQIYELSVNNEFNQRISSSIAKSANNISGEDPSSYGGVGSIWANKRHQLATNVINTPKSFAKIFALQAAAQPGLNSVITIESNGSLTYTGAGTLDNDIDFTVNSLWDDVAGVSYEDKNP
jgi:hypothetical protein